MVKTDHENKELNDLLLYLREKHPTVKIEKSKEIIHDALDAVYCDQELRSIYNKRTIAIEAINHMLHGRKTNNDMIEYEVDRLIHCYEMKRSRGEYSPFSSDKTCCRQSCYIM
jgi:hypothetical protein